MRIPSTRPSAATLKSIPVLGWGSALCAAALSLSAVFAFGGPGLARTPPAQAKAENLSSPAKDTRETPPAIVVGFVGGFVRHDDLVHAEVQLAANLRKEYSTGVDVETFENSHIEDARKKILSVLDVNHDGTLSPGEKQNARIVLYGHSWGASAVVTLARELQKDGIPVLLTVQVDSIAKYRQNDSLIPANVAQAANFYQPDGFVHGQPVIRAADPSRTKIIGNFRSEYRDRPYACGAYPWYDRVFTRTHTQIECDPILWKQVETLIRAALQTKTASGSIP